ncbi:M23 family metallopeptidase [Streptomyces sp. NPDC051320]|uniref:M23 family metallopeptidase n=1 Tax=Streptomyces sp. NPDC051320 TaxID=3154644 RepID=UPI00342D32D6
MASNNPAPETLYFPNDESLGFGGEDGGTFDEWNPTEESLRPLRGKHRVAKQRGGIARSSTVLGVGVIAAVGAGGMASAQAKPPVSISLPDLPQSVKDKLPDAESLPGVGTLISDIDGHSSSGDATEAGAAHAAIGTASTGAVGSDSNAGEALRSRILLQAEQQQSAVDDQAAVAAEKAAAAKAAAEAAKQQEAAAAKEKAAKQKAEAEAKAKAERERLAKVAASYSLPVASYTLTSHFGDSGSMWSSGYHTGLDFAAPTGTPIKAVHSGTVKSAGWSGSYGYRTVITLDDGTELWFCHQSSIAVSAGQKVTTGQVIGNVGATGNVTGPHLHLEVRPGGGDPIDPLTWLASRGINA